MYGQCPKCGQAITFVNAVPLGGTLPGVAYRRPSIGCGVLLGCQIRSKGSIHFSQVTTTGGLWAGSPLAFRLVTLGGHW
jgi:hypothetical protein